MNHTYTYLNTVQHSAYYDMPLNIDMESLYQALYKDIHESTKKPQRVRYCTACVYDIDGIKVLRSYDSMAAFSIPYYEIYLTSELRRYSTTTSKHIRYFYSDFVQFGECRAIEFPMNFTSHIGGLARTYPTVPYIDNVKRELWV